MLVVLLAEYCGVRHALGEKFGHHSGDAAEEMWPELILQSGKSGAFRNDPGRETFGIHDIDRRRPNQIGIDAAQGRGVLVKAAWVACQILVRCKLRWINEDRHDDTIGMPPGETHEREVAVMQGAHGRNQRHGFAGGTKPGDCPAQNRNAPRDRNF